MNPAQQRRLEQLATAFGLLLAVQVAILTGSQPLATRAFHGAVTLGPGAIIAIALDQSSGIAAVLSAR